MWTKSEMDKLTVEQQEVVGRFESRYESSKMWPRELLLKKARGRSDWDFFITGLFITIGIGIIYFYCDDQKIKFFAIIISSVLLLQIQAARTDRRLDVLLELLDFDRKSKDDSDNSKTEKAG
jgi:hypothetical protein